MSHHSCHSARVLIPRASVLSRPLEHCEIPVQCCTEAQAFVHHPAVLVRVPDFFTSGWGRQRKKYQQRERLALLYSLERYIARLSTVSNVHGPTYQNVCRRTTSFRETVVAEKNNRRVIKFTFRNPLVSPCLTSPIPEFADIYVPCGLKMNDVCVRKRFCETKRIAPLLHTTLIRYNQQLH